MASPWTLSLSTARNFALFLLHIALALVCLSSPAFAQQPDTAMDDMFEAIEFDKEKGKREPLPASNIKAVNLGVHWQLMMRVISEGENAENETRALREHQISMGTKNAPAYMLAAIKHIEDTHAQGKISTSTAAINLKAAHILAPDLPHAHLAHARHLLRHSPGKLGEITKSVITGWKKSLSWHDTGRPLRYNLVVHGLIAFLCASLIFILMQVVRYFSVLSYDLTRVLPSGFSSVQAVLALLALVIIPGLVLQAPIISLFILLCGIAIVQQPRERVVTLLCFAVLAALPTIEKKMSPYVTWNVGSSQQLVDAQYLPCDDACTETWLTRHSEQQDRDVVLAYTAWLLQYKSGRTQALLESGELSKESVASWPKTLRGEAYNLLGATLVAQNKPEEAIEILTEAEALLPQSAAPSLNIMRAAQMTGEREQARGALERANTRNLNPPLEFLDLERRDVNSTLIVNPMPLQTFWSRHLAEHATDVKIIEPIWPLLAGDSLPFESARWMGLLGLVLGLLSIPIPLTHRCSTPCPSCGLARSPHDSIKNSNHPYCMSCYEAFVMGASMSYNERVASDAMLHSRRKRQNASRRFMSLIIPGSGHILAGYGMAGMLMVTLFGLAVLTIAHPQGFWRAPSQLIFEDWFGRQVLAGLALLILVFVALWILRQGLQPVQVSTYHYVREEEPSNPRDMP